MMAKRQVRKRKAAGDVEQFAPPPPEPQGNGGGIRALPTEHAEGWEALADVVDAAPSPEPEPEPETRYAVYRPEGPGNYRGQFAPKHLGLLMVNAEISLPPKDHEKAEADGLEFVRWARGS